MNQTLTLFLAAWMAGLGLDSARAQAAAQTNTTAVVAVYDSRAVAYAHFCSEEHMKQLNDLMTRAKAAKAAGDSAQLEILQQKLRDERDRSHLQVFSTAPVEDMLEGLKDRVATIRQETGASQLVSKWDLAALAKLKSSRQVDVTDRLVAGFKLNEKQTRTLAGLFKQKPLALEKARELVKQGKL